MITSNKDRGALSMEDQINGGANVVSPFSKSNDLYWSRAVENDIVDLHSAIKNAIRLTFSALNITNNHDTATPDATKAVRIDALIRLAPELIRVRDLLEASGIVDGGE